MTRTYGYFASSDAENPTTYSQVQFARQRALECPNGIIQGIGDAFAVTACDPVIMKVIVGTGAMFAQGYWMESDAAEELTISPADDTYPRIDRVVARFDIISNLDVTFAVLTGTAAAEPTAPPLTRTASIYEVPLANIDVAAGVTSINDTHITDEREYRDATDLFHYPISIHPGRNLGTVSKLQYDNDDNLWLAKNAAYDESTGTWSQVDTSKNSTAICLNAGGSIELLFCESGSGEITWNNKEPGVSTGDIKITACATAPSGWLICDGSAVSRTTYSGLFAAIGTTYGGGNGSTTFNLPDLRGRFALGVSSGHALATKGGAETVTLTEQQIPGHNHTMPYFIGGSSYTQRGVTYPSSSEKTSTCTTSSTGGGQAHNNMPPYLSLNYIIKY